MQQHNLEEENTTWTIDFESIQNLEFEKAQDVENYIKTWALGNGFELSKPTGSKSYAIYTQCSRSGQPRTFAGTIGKRNKSSKKIGKIKSQYL